MGRSKTFIFIAALLLTACGGGGGGGGGPAAPAPVTTAEGMWTGTTSTNRTMSGVVLNDGTYWFIYSLPGTPNALDGFINGTGNSLNSNFTSSDGIDFRFSGSDLPTTISATYAGRSTLNGSLSQGAGGLTFTTSYDNGYDNVHTQAEIVGTYSGSVTSSVGQDNATVTIAPNGSITGASASGCNLSGQATVRSRGALYNVSVTFGAGCLANGQTWNGIAFYNGAVKQLIAAALPSNRSDSLFFLGIKP